MRVPLEWLGQYVDLSPYAGDWHRLAADLAGIGLEEEDFFGPAVTGPLVVARVLAMEPEEHSNGKTVNWCQLDVGEDSPRGIVCGAHNFAVGDLVAAALPGSVLPGGFAIAARKTYGHVSDGMICSARELGLGEDHDGIIVLADWGLDASPGDDAKALLGLDSTTLDVNVTPDRGYQLSMRGIGREYAMLTGQSFADPADGEALAPAPDGFPVELADTAPIHGTAGCDRFTALRVSGVDPTARTPFWMAKRLLDAGMRPISLCVDVTNYVMLELGQPLHAYDAAKLREPIVVRRARPGEKLTTLDGAERSLDPEDLLIADAGGERIIGLAGVMGGADTEVEADTDTVIVEAAHFDPITVARTSRRHRLPSEAARRFERGVDPALGPAAARRCAQLIADLGGGTIGPATVVGEAPAPRTIELPVAAPARRVGVAYTPDQVVAALEAVGCRIADKAEAAAPDAVLAVTVPTWRPDLTAAEDLIEEVARVCGYEQIPSRQPQAPGGAGLSRAQRARRTVSQLLAALGLTEVLTYPFTSEARSDALLIPADDPRRASLRLANPLAEDQPLLRTSLLPTLVDAVARNTGRGFKDVAVFEAGLVTLPGGALPEGLTFEPGYHPTEDELSRIFASVPAQPYHYAGAITGHWDLPGSWGSGRRAEAADAIDVVRRAIAALGLRAEVEAAAHAPFHPGRCARFALADGSTAGYAGELHPKVLENLGLPARTVAFEFDLDVLLAQAPERDWDGALSAYPVSRQDVALLVASDAPAAEVARALRAGAGAELEDIELFDVYTGDQVGEGQKSLAFRLTFRAADRTLTAAEASALREAATAVAAERFGATVRS
ncbi:phenylalanine--tRNA ligase subunit beta [Brevibacterium sp. 5221]|uniref:Phenylalanine--tRNA ligase beta subunit n=1 Tax=Brevibacterium rongguiense TaxID=2695267 RepID=A0A6N9H7E0_9MICO|nr:MULTISPECIES: phenylalanine--tRNA ligase subunit beta [Brevibacterium]MYM19462.1 phenylalanine--tRNA ligase subunit beta [Brevibacterium rongguiense]WAL41180.1 phenylalanine--tRNA ligase subunit beta [Brevibacterium sp. BRM-1]